MNLKVKLKALDKFIFPGLFKEDQLITLLRKEVLPECKTLLDIGCGGASPIISFSKKLEYSVGVDGFKPAIDSSKALKIHSEYRYQDVMDSLKDFNDKSFDAAIAIDLIEHLEIDQGKKLILEMIRIAKKKVIIFTPNGFVDQDEYNNNVLQKHKSGWNPEFMQNQGFEVFGLNGLKSLRGKHATFRFKPQFIWARISYLTQPLVFKHPKQAFHIFCIRKP